LLFGLNRAGFRQFRILRFLTPVCSDAWQTTLKKLLGPNKQIGSYFGTSSRLAEAATQRGTKFLKNITGKS
jgi:hypothetical protein